MEGQGKNNSSYSFKFFDTWLKDQSCLDIITACWIKDWHNQTNALIFNLKNLANQFSFWRKNVFGLPAKKIRNLLTEIENLNKKKGSQNFINSKMLCLEKLYHTEEEISKQLSRNNIINLGERNTRYFHLKTMKRRKRNNIDCLISSDARELKDKKDIAL